MALPGCPAVPSGVPVCSMSEYYHYTFDFLIRQDSPAPLRRALEMLARRTVPSEEDLSGLPPVVDYYLRHPDPPRGVAGDGFTYRYAPQGPGGVYSVHLERSFHDDEFATAGLYFVAWLTQFAAKDGYIGMVKADDSELPSLLIRDGDDLVQSDLGLNPSDEYGIRPDDTPIDHDTPVRLCRHTRMHLPTVLEALRGLVWP